MYLIVLVFGALLVIAGIVLAAPGVSIHEHAFDATTVTPGIVAVIGGLVLFGLGLALRVLQRIERALAARPIPSATRRGEPALPGTASEFPDEPARVSIPSRAFSRPYPTPGAISALEPSAAEKRLDEMAEKLPAAARLEIPRNAAETDVSPSSKSLEPQSPSPAALSRAENEGGEIDELRAARRNGATTARITPRLDLNARFPVASERSNGPAFDSLWPKGPRPARTVQQSPAPSVADPAVETKQNNEPAPEAPPPVATDAPAPVAILKSGVVDGMAYTLFSDGSIEADLPQGRLRFGSITELRNHIERSA